MQRGLKMKLADRSDLKRQNRRTVYEYIQGAPGQTASGVQISRDTGISLPTVLRILEYFTGYGLLKAVEMPQNGSSAVGRRPTLLQFVPRRYLNVGLAYDSIFLELSLMDLNSKVLASDRFRVQGSVEELMGTVIEGALCGR